MKIFEINPVFDYPFDFEIEEGKLYIWADYTMHLCACGCKGRVYTHIKNGEWQLTNNKGLITLRPSIGNWKGENPYHAHYYITENKIEWL